MFMFVGHGISSDIEEIINLLSGYTMNGKSLLICNTPQVNLILVIMYFYPPVKKSFS